MTKQIPALPPLDEAPADDDRFVLRDTSSGSDKSMRVDRLLERSGEQVSEHAEEQGGIHGIPADERALHSQELRAAVSTATTTAEAVSMTGKGAIVESDTNANGSYVRWENGEQVCLIPEAELTGISGSTHNQEFTWPASFSITLLVVSNLDRRTAEWDAGDDRRSFVTANPGTDVARILIFRDNGDTFGGTFGKCSIIGWGFWK